MNRYVKMTTLHPLYIPTRLMLCGQFESETGRRFSETPNSAGTVSWAKVTTNIPASVGGCILDVEEGDNSRARADMAEPEWSA